MSSKTKGIPLVSNMLTPVALRVEWLLARRVVSSVIDAAVGWWCSSCSCACCCCHQWFPIRSVEASLQEKRTPLPLLPRSLNAPPGECVLNTRTRPSRRAVVSPGHRKKRMSQKRGGLRGAACCCSSGLCCRLVEVNGALVDGDADWCTQWLSTNFQVRTNPSQSPIILASTCPFGKKYAKQWRRSPFDVTRKSSVGLGRGAFTGKRRLSFFSDFTH